jgi:hypothetical protein
MICHRCYHINGGDTPLTPGAKRHFVVTFKKVTLLL